MEVGRGEAAAWREGSGEGWAVGGAAVAEAAAAEALVWVREGVAG